MGVSNSHIKSSLLSIKERIVELASGDITDKTQGEIGGLAHELGDLADDVDDSNLKRPYVMLHRCWGVVLVGIRSTSYLTTSTLRC